MVYIRVHLNIDICMHTYIFMEYIYIHEYILTCIYVYKHMYLCIQMYTHKYIRMYTQGYTHTRAYINMHIYIYYHVLKILVNTTKIIFIS